MRTRTAVATAVVALACLMVSLSALWPRLDTGPQVPGVEPGPSAALTTEAPERAVLPPTPADAASSPAPKPPRALRVPKPPRTLRVEVPTAGIDSRVRPVGVSPDGQMALPPDPEVLGWYRYGPAAGSGNGSVVLAGHLDAERFGLGPLVGLREVEVGDKVDVALADGSETAYTVADVRRYDREALPDELFARTGPERLRIITCGGDYLPDEGGYQENLVVTAVPS